ncbi:MAG TPA: FAD-dependent oxidoreductase [Microlunatus sp.]|nr:FAD-dependent oxidoreductase [Microlunatus sp.]
MSTTPQHVVVVGASLAGLSTVRALRSQGFAGQVTVIGDELHRPYDRPPLSKEFLASITDQLELSLEADGEDLDVTWRLGERARNLRQRPGGGASIQLRDGQSVVGDRVVIATGAAARCGIAGLGLPGVHLLRTLDDAVSLRRDLHDAAVSGRPVVVVGGGFIGSEVAATARQLGCRVTLVVPDDVALRSALGHYADAVADLHASHDVTVRPHARVREVRAGAAGLEVIIQNGHRIPAATVVLGIGAVPAVGWLADSGLDLGDGAGAIRCDEHGATGLEGVYAVGDCAAWHSPGLGYHHQIEHWTSAKERGAVVAARLLEAERVPTCRPPYVWSDLYGKKLQLAGYRDLADHPPGPEHTLEAGSIGTGSFTAVFRRAGEPVAVLSLDQPRQFAAIRRRLVSAPVTTPAEGAPA